MREAPSPPAVLATMRALAIDGVTVEVVGALEDAGVRAILLKGPVVARWLYADGTARPYGDTDLLVEGRCEQEAEAVLARLGFEAAPGTGRTDPGIARNHVWRRDGSIVELHVTLTGIGVPPADAWAALTAETDVIELRDRRVPTLSAPGRLLHVALHAAQHGPEFGKALDDLSRACAVHPVEEWRAVAALAVRLRSIDALSAGLALNQRGLEIRRELGLPDPHDPLVVLRAQSASPVALGLARLAQESTRTRVAHVARGLAPTPSFLRWWTPLAHRGPLGLATAYVWRYAYLAGASPSAVRDFRRARRRPSPPHDSANRDGTRGS